MIFLCFRVCVCVVRVLGVFFGSHDLRRMPKSRRFRVLKMLPIYARSMGVYRVGTREATRSDQTVATEERTGKAPARVRLCNTDG